MLLPRSNCGISHLSMSSNTPPCSLSQSIYTAHLPNRISQSCALDSQAPVVRSCNMISSHIFRKWKHVTYHQHQDAKTEATPHVRTKKRMCCSSARVRPCIICIAMTAAFGRQAFMRLALMSSLFNWTCVWWKLRMPTQLGHGQISLRSYLLRMEL